MLGGGLAKERMARKVPSRLSACAIRGRGTRHDSLRGLGAWRALTPLLGGAPFRSSSSVCAYHASNPLTQPMTHLPHRDLPRLRVVRLLALQRHRRGSGGRATARRQQGERIPGPDGGVKDPGRGSEVLPAAADEIKHSAPMY